MVAWRKAANTGLVSAADRAYRKAPVHRPTSDFGTKCPELVDTLTKKRTDFLLKIGMGGKAILGLSRLDYPSAKTGEAVNGGAFMRRSS